MGFSLYPVYPIHVTEKLQQWRSKARSQFPEAAADLGPQGRDTFPIGGAAPQGAASPTFSELLNFDPECNALPPTSTFDSLGPENTESFNSAEQSLNLVNGWTFDSLHTHQIAASCALNGCQPLQCNSQIYGREGPCLSVAALPEIEECGKAPRLSGSAGAPLPLDTTSARPSPRLSPLSKIQLAENQSQEPAIKRARRGNSNSSSSEDESQSRIRSKQAHSVVERRYRNNLNGKILQLHRTLIAAEGAAKYNGIQTELVSVSENRSRVRKSDILTDAMNYVHQTEVEMRHMADEIENLNARVRSLEKLVNCEDCALLKQMVQMQLQQPSG